MIKHALKSYLNTLTVNTDHYLPSVIVTRLSDNTWEVRNRDFVSSIVYKYYSLDGVTIAVLKLAYPNDYLEERMEEILND